MREKNVDLLFAPQKRNCIIHKHNMLIHTGAFTTTICKTSCQLSPRAVLDNVRAFLK